LAAHTTSGLRERDDLVAGLANHAHCGAQRGELGIRGSPEVGAMRQERLQPVVVGIRDIEAMELEIDEL